MQPVLSATISHTPVGNLQIGISHHIGLHRLPEVLQTYSRNFPEVKLDLEFVDSEQGFASVLNGDIEVGIITLPPENHSIAHLRVQEIWPDPLIFTTSPGHALTKQQTIELEELTKFSAILPNKQTFTRGCRISFHGKKTQFLCQYEH